MAEDLSYYTSKLMKAEAEIKELEHMIAQCSDNASFNMDETSFDPEVEKLRIHNQKLKYQANHLKNSIKEAEERLSSYMLSVQGCLTEVFDNALHAAYPALTSTKVQLTPSTQAKFGEYQCNSAMSVAKTLKESGQGAAPRSIAENILKNLPKSDMVDKVEIAGPGFINIHLNRQYAASYILDQLKHGVRPPPVGPQRKVIVDMSSPNIAKEMHVGHLRSTIIGESISRLCEFIGHRVLKLNHLGDWGTQFGMLITHLTEKFPNYKTVSPPIGDLQAFYKESKVRFDTDEEFKKRAYAAVVKLQSHDEDHITAWTLICNESRKEFTKIYERLDIKNLVDRGESFYQEMMEETVKLLKDKDMLELDEGRWIMWCNNVETPLTVIKSDGGFTYDTSDLTAIRHRLFEERADWIIYVIDQGQAIHMKGIFGCAEKVGWLQREHTRVEHVGFGVVLGDDKKKFKTRSGDTVRLVDLMNEGIARCEQKLKSKGRHEVLTAAELEAAKEAVAYGCIKYADLSHNRINDYVFSFDKMLDDKGNTAVYLLYAYMRIRAINRAAGIDDEKLREMIQSASAQLFTLQNPHEWKLAQHLIRFSDIILRCVDDFTLHLLCDYLYELAGIFTEFYDHCYVVEKNRESGVVEKINTDRLLLCQATADIMAKGFHILGIRTVEKL